MREQVERSNRFKQVRATDDLRSWSRKSLGDDVDDFDLCCRTM